MPWTLSTPLLEFWNWKIWSGISKSILETVLESAEIRALLPTASILLLNNTVEKVESLPKSEAILSKIKGVPYSPTYLSCQVVFSKKTIKVLLRKVAPVIASLVGASTNPPWPKISVLHAVAAVGSPTALNRHLLNMLAAAAGVAPSQTLRAKDRKS